MGQIVTYCTSSDPTSLATIEFAKYEDPTSTTIRDNARIERDRKESIRQNWIDAINNGEGNPYVISILVDEYGSEIVETLFDDGDRAIHKAASAGNLLLLEELANVLDAMIDVPNAFTGDTPLMKSIQLGQTQIVQFLLAQHPTHDLHGLPARLDLRNEAGESATDIAKSCENEFIWELVCPDLVDALLEQKQSRSRQSKQFLAIPEDRERDNDDEEEWSYSSQTETDIATASSWTTESVVSLTSMTSDLRSHLSEHDKQRMESFEGWLDVRKTNGLVSFRRWQNRHVVLQDEYIGWAASAIAVRDMRSKSNQRKFEKIVHLGRLIRVEKVESAQQYLFRIHFKRNSVDSESVYEFRLPHMEMRDEWVAQIEERSSRCQVEGKRRSSSQFVPRM